MARLMTTNGFEWRLVAWGKPDSPRRPLCSYCAGKIGEDDIPLMMFKTDGSLAQFCDKCIQTYFETAAEG